MEGAPGRVGVDDLERAEGSVPETAGEPERSDDLRRDYRRRARGLWVVALAAALAWYGATAVESRSMGYGPFVRRPYTLFDWVLYAVIVAGVLLAVRRIRRCPRCGHGFGFRSVEECPSCGGRVK